MVTLVTGAGADGVAVAVVVGAGEGGGGRNGVFWQVGGVAAQHIRPKASKCQNRLCV